MPVGIEVAETKLEAEAAQVGPVDGQRLAIQDETAQRIPSQDDLELRVGVRLPDRQVRAAKPVPRPDGTQEQLVDIEIARIADHRVEDAVAVDVAHREGLIVERDGRKGCQLATGGAVVDRQRRPASGDDPGPARLDPAGEADQPVLAPKRAVGLDERAFTMLEQVPVAAIVFRICRNENLRPTVAVEIDDLQTLQADVVPAHGPCPLEMELGIGAG